ncbi:hypothetical protein [Clostridium tyrobutyricum]|uniref:hypothetical protein n=1 Tax=Clostridium tyrobutyricum TaxID=1519 RepID=UPI001C394872|nr:hypothetical protein [Clostridium tyrobutyricum]MBV4428297.1 hypothetical protein [Clostridium tyrobutyricum]MBV4443287.1 hypothetical protein [Clostridium tyrobutyricum]
MTLLQKLKEATEKGQIKDPFSTKDLKSWIKKYNIKKDEDNTEYENSYIESFLSSSTIDSSSTKTDKELYRMPNQLGKYTFNK